MHRTAALDPMLSPYPLSIANPFLQPIGEFAKENLQAIEKHRKASCGETDEQDEGQATEDVKSQPAEADCTPKPEGVF
jgi:hypothetical protein